MGSFKGASDFGEVRVPASEIKMVLFKLQVCITAIVDRNKAIVVPDVPL
jgi:hypothetical protein